MNFNEGIDFPDRFELDAEEAFVQADRLLAEGAVTEAVEKLTQILKRNPHFGKAYNHLGWVYAKYKNINRAEECYQAAIKHAPDYNATYLNYCYLLSSLGRFAELKEHLDKMSNIASIAKETIYIEYAILYEQQGNLTDAIDYYHKAAITTLDTLNLNKYKESIERCQKKQDLSSYSSDFWKSNEIID